jgi:hypothetical protein
MPNDDDLSPHFAASLDMIVWLLRPRLCNDWTLDMKRRRRSFSKGADDADSCNELHHRIAQGSFAAVPENTAT